MKVGDLVRCTWQPNVSRVENDALTGHRRAIPMKHQIKGEIGLILRIEQKRMFSVFFPKFSYTHVLTSPTLEVINESR